MSLNLTNINNKIFITNCLFSALILSFIAGNLIVNLNILLFIFFSIFFYHKELFKIKIDIIDKIILTLFIYIFINGIFNNIFFVIKNSSSDYSIFLKSVLFIRFLVLYFIVKILILKKIIQLKYFFIVALIASIFVSFDIFFQLFFGQDIFGFQAEKFGRRLSGPFGDELIAGGYLQKFSLLALFTLPVYFNLNKSMRNILIIFLICVFVIAIVLSGNRVPLVMFLLIVSAITIFEKQLRKYFFIFLFLALSIFSSAYYLNDNVKMHFYNFSNKIKQSFLILSPKNIVSEKELKEEFSGENKSNLFYTFKYKGNIYKMNNTHQKEFKTGYEAWKVNKIFGGGLNSFLKTCQSNNIGNCSNHPHNYYLEILTELGLVGFIILIFLIYIIFYETLIKKYFKKSFLKKNHVITPFIFLFLAEFFPFKSTGSFFTTSSATYIFLIIPIIAALYKTKEID